MNADYDYLYDPLSRHAWDRTEEDDPEPFDVEGDFTALYDVPLTPMAHVRAQGDGWTEVAGCDEPRTYADTDTGEDTHD